MRATVLGPSIWSLIGINMVVLCYKVGEVAKLFFLISSLFAGVFGWCQMHKCFSRKLN